MARKKAATEKTVPPGDFEEWTEEDYDRMTSPEALMARAETMADEWRKTAPARYKNLLDAKAAATPGKRKK